VKVNKTTIFRFLRYLPLIVLVVLLTFFVVRNGISAIDNLIAKFSNRRWLTAAAFMGLFLIKSVSFGLPYTLLYIAIGSIYPLGWALVLNILGIAVNMQIPYFFGRSAGRGYTDRLLVKFPKFGDLEGFSQRSGVFFTFMVKFIGLVPHEISNIFLGSLHVPYVKYMTGGILGLLPGMVATTLIGISIKTPDSPVFIISVVVVVLLVVLSFVLYRRQVSSNSPRI